MNKRQGVGKTIPKEREDRLKEANRILKGEVKRLKKEIGALNREVKQLEEALAKNFEHISDMMDNITVEEAINLAKKRRKKPQEDTKELVRQRFARMYGKRGKENED